MAYKNTIILNDMIAFFIQKEITLSRPYVTTLYFVNRRDLDQAAELMIVSVRCYSICNKFTVIIIVPITKVNCTILSCDSCCIGNSITVRIGCVLFDRTDNHSGISIPIILIVAANVVINVDLRTYITIFKMYKSVSAEHTHNSATSNVPRAPKSRYLIRSINSNIGKCQLT